MKESKSKAEEGWEATIKLCEKTEGVALALYSDSLDNKKSEDSFLCIISDGENYKCLYAENWKEVEEFKNENPDFVNVYYCNVYDCDIHYSELAEQAYGNPYTWPDIDVDMATAITKTINDDNSIWGGNYPHIPVELIYDGQIIYDFVL